MTPLLHAQCDYTAGTGCDITYSSSTVISSDIAWSGTICVGATITVSGAGTTLTITSGTNVSFAAGAQIIVEEDAELIIENAELYASGGSGMWKGIKGEPGCYIYIAGSKILHADMGLHVQGEAGGTSILEVTGGTCFGNNEIGIFLEGDADYLVHTIEDTEIAAPALVAPLSGEIGDYGILIVGPDDVVSELFTVGNTDTYTGSSTYNHIHDVAIGIRVFTADVLVQNCFIEDMLITEASDMPSGDPVNEFPAFDEGNIGILATSTNSFNLDNNLYVGSSILSGSSVNNNFYQSTDAGFIAILASNSVSTEIYSNRIAADTPDDVYLMKEGIRIQNQTSDHDIRNNSISNFLDYGIISDNITNGTTLIQGNTITNDVNPATDEIPIGIYVDDAVTNQLVEISDNVIERVEHGIFIRNHDDAIVNGNIIEYDYGAGNTRGIYAINCSDILIEANSVTGPCYTGCPGSTIVAGIYVETCEGMFLKSNYSTNTKFGAVIDGNNQTGNMNCNEMYNCLIGYAMNDVDVGIGSNDLGPIEKYIMMDYLPADNSWYPSNTANREKSYGSTDLTNLDWRYRDLYFDGTTPLPGFDMPSGLVDDPFLVPIDEYSDYLDTCSSPYRLSGETEEALFDAFVYKFSHWIHTALEGGLDGSVYLYKKYYWNLLQQYRQFIDSLEDAYLELYASIKNTNIPTFYDIQRFVKTAEYDSATILLEKVSPANAMEESLTFVIPFTFISADSTSIYFTDSDYEALYTLANDDPKMYGPAVYIAQAILGIRVEDELIDEAEEKINLTPAANYTLFPNPANQTFTISGNLNQHKDLKIEIYNIHGHCILKSAFTFNQSVDIGHLNTGIYFIKLMNADQVIFIENFQILK